MLHSLMLCALTAGSPVDVPEELRAEVVEGYADFAHRLYARCEQLALELQVKVTELVAEPNEDTLAAARGAWLDGRRLFGRTEVLRFYNGPIDNPRDGVETLLNAWPLDEAYIDAVEGAPGSGIINDPATYPNLSATLLTLLNERGGEANVAVGWHAVEFLLWGQDLDPRGPGRRSPDDFLPGRAPNAERRSLYLTLCAELLVEHHRQVRAAWEPEEAPYRAAFVGDPETGLRRILAGMIILSGFEMAGERLAVAYETQDQEEEHSCFSDTTHVDFRADQEGLLAVYHGAARPAYGGRGPGVRAIAAALDPKLAERLDQQLDASLAAIEGMPVPFDQAILGDEQAPGRRAVLLALTSIERQAETLAALALALGYEIGMHPGG